MIYIISGRCRCLRCAAALTLALVLSTVAKGQFQSSLVGVGSFCCRAALPPVLLLLAL